MRRVVALALLGRRLRHGRRLRQLTRSDENVVEIFDPTAG
jgi:hypothetical protein